MPSSSLPYLEAADLGHVARYVPVGESDPPLNTFFRVTLDALSPMLNLDSPPNSPPFKAGKRTSRRYSAREYVNTSFELRFVGTAYRFEGHVTENLTASHDFHPSNTLYTLRSVNSTTVVGGQNAGLGSMSGLDVGSYLVNTSFGDFTVAFNDATIDIPVTTKGVIA